MDPQFSQRPVGSSLKNPGVNPLLGPVTGPGLSIALIKVTGSGPCSIVTKGSIWWQVLKTLVGSDNTFLFELN